MEEAKEPSMRQVRLDLALTALVKAENLDVTDEDSEAEYNKVA